MTKTIGAKVPDALYERVAEFGCISNIVRKAVEEYLKIHSKPSLTSVNRKENNNEYQNINNEVGSVICLKSNNSQLPAFQSNFKEM